MLYPASGGAALGRGKTAIRLAYHGCTNRPFFHIVVNNVYRDRNSRPIEQLGTYDPLPNADNQKLVSVNLDRVQFWIGRGSIISRPVSELLGLMGFLPLHPRTYQLAWRNREKAAKEAEKAEAEAKAPTAPSSASAS